MGKQKEKVVPRRKKEVVKAIHCRDGSVFQLIIFADDCKPCPDCGEPWCAAHGMHYSECTCLGPTQDGVEYRVFGGYLYGRRIKNAEEEEKKEEGMLK